MNTKKIMKKRAGLVFLFLIALFSISPVFAVANFIVNSFSCTPSEVAINSVFSCTAQIKNNGGDPGSVSIATLYPDSNWLEETIYPVSSGTTVNPGQSTEVTFSGLRATKSGSNGFLKIMLDNVADNYVSDNNINVNVIDVAVVTSSSASSANSGASFDVTATVSAGGSIDVILTFNVNSGGCSIGSQTSQKTISGMNDGNSQSRTWTVTQGTGGACSYTTSAAATGSGGIASKIDSSSGSISCPNCVITTITTSSSGGGGAAGAGGAGVKVYTLGEFISAQAVELAKGEQIKFNLSGLEHIITLKELSSSSVTITIQSKLQTMTIALEERKLVDLNEDGVSDISVKLSSINSITNKATLIIALASEKIPAVESAEGAKGEMKEAEKETIFKEIAGEKSIFLLIAIIGIALVAVISLYFYFRTKKRRKY